MNWQTPREKSRAQRLKDSVIRAVIHAYNSVPKEQVVTGWTKAGEYVYQDSQVSDHQPGYLSAWDPRTHVGALASFHAGTLFCEGMSGGVSVVGGPHFVPKAGRKKRQGAADPTGPAPDAGTEPSVRETAASAQEYSEYNSSQCPDEFIDSDDEENNVNLFGGQQSTSRARINVLSLTPHKLGFRQWNPAECNLLTHLNHIRIPLKVHLTNRTGTNTDMSNMILLTLPSTYSWVGDTIEVGDKTDVFKFMALLVKLIDGGAATQLRNFTDAPREYRAPLGIHEPTQANV